METICVACNVKCYGMIGIYKHPKKLDEMFSKFSGFEVLSGDHLCIQCYEDLKFSLDFKTKIDASCQSRRNNSDEVRNRILEIRDITEFGVRNVEQLEGDEKEYQVMITSTSEQDVDESQLDPLLKSSPSPKEGEDVSPLSNQKNKRKNILPRKSPRTHKQSPVTEKPSPSKPLIRKRTTVETADEDINEAGTKEIIILSYDDYNSERATFELFDGETDDTTTEIIMEDDGSDTEDYTGKEHEVTTSKGKTIIKSHKCQYCSKFFRYKTALEGHHRTHTGSKPFSCEYCDKSFAEMGNLRQHTNSMHLNQRKYSCDKCKKTFKTHYSHQVHIRSCITKEKPFRCQFCVKGFYSSGKLKLHIRTHTNERPYPCPHCSSAFKDNTALKRHVGRVHVKTETKVERDDQETSESQGELLKD